MNIGICRLERECNYYHRNANCLLKDKTIKHKCVVNHKVQYFLLRVFLSLQNTCVKYYHGYLPFVVVKYSLFLV